MGADFRYRRKPWFFHARYSDDKIDTTAASSDVKTLTLNGKYFKELAGGNKLSFEANFSPSTFSNSVGVHGDTGNASLGNILEIGRFRAYSTVAGSRLTQSGGGALATDSSQLSWFEQLNADLPYHLRADLIYRYQENESEYGGPLDPTRNTLKGILRNLEFDLRHQLYKSLQTLYRFLDNSSSSSGGTTDTIDNSLTFMYTKQIPRGQILFNLYGGIGQTTSVGQAQVVDELHPDTAVPGTFLLQKSPVDTASVVVFVRSPQPPNELIRLIENLNYTVTVVGNSTEITILSLPAEFPVPGKYDFRVSYSLTGGDFTQRTRTFGEALSVQLFDNLLTPYFNYASVRTSVLEGVAPGGGYNSDSLATGVLFYKEPVRARVEYQDVSWAVNPFHGWRAEVQVTGPLTQTTTGNAFLSYQRREITQTPTDGAPFTYTETNSSAYGNVQQTFYSRSLSISAGGSYSLVNGLSDSHSWTLSGTLNWKIGKLDVTGGANYSRLDTESGTAVSTSRTYQYYYLRLRRTIF